MSFVNTLRILSTTLILSLVCLLSRTVRDVLFWIRHKSSPKPQANQKLRKFVETKNLTSITQVSEDGFGDKANRYAFAMESFKDKLYVGTSHIKYPVPGLYQFAAGYPLSSAGAQMYSFSEDENTWSQVVSGGLTDNSNFAIRKLRAIDDYMLAVSVNHEKGFEVWGTLNGSNWVILVTGGFNSKNNSSGRGITKFGDYVYVTTENRETGAELWRCSSDNIKAYLSSPKQEKDKDSLKLWEQVANKGLGDSQNFWFSDLLVFEDELYMGTMNNVSGFSLFKSEDGRNFSEIAKNGATSRFNHAAMLLTEFNGELYVSTMNWVQGFSVFVLQKRNNQNVLNPVLTNGFNSPSNAYVWQMYVYKDRLYAGTFQNSYVALRFGMFSLYSTANGRDWDVETDNAFSSKGIFWFLGKEVGDYGIRTLKVHNDKLYIGTATAHNSCKIYKAEAKK